MSPIRLMVLRRFDLEPQPSGIAQAGRLRKDQANLDEEEGAGRVSEGTVHCKRKLQVRSFRILLLISNCFTRAAARGHPPHNRIPSLFWQFMRVHSRQRSTRLKSPRSRPTRLFLNSDGQSKAVPCTTFTATIESPVRS
jgi:hypothetical protein